MGVRIFTVDRPIPGDVEPRRALGAHDDGISRVLDVPYELKPT